jgi:cobalamin biosynthesis protein CbiD
MRFQWRLLTTSVHAPWNARAGEKCAAQTTNHSNRLCHPPPISVVISDAVGTTIRANQKNALIKEMICGHNGRRIDRPL